MVVESDNHLSTWLPAIESLSFVGSGYDTFPSGQLSGYLSPRVVSSSSSHRARHASRTDLGPLCLLSWRHKMSQDAVTLCKEVFDCDSEPTDKGNSWYLCLRYKQLYFHDSDTSYSIIDSRSKYEFRTLPTRLSLCFNLIFSTSL